VLYPVDLALHLAMCCYLPVHSNVFHSLASFQGLHISGLNPGLSRDSGGNPPLLEIRNQLLATSGLSADAMANFELFFQSLPVLTYHPRNQSFALFAAGEGRTLSRSRLVDFTLVASSSQIRDVPTQQWRGAEAQHLLSVMRLIFAAQIAGLVGAALDMTASFVRERKQFDVPVGGFQAVQHLLSDVCLRSESMLALVELAAAYADASDEQFGNAADAALRYANEYGRVCIEKCLQAHGGIAYTWEYPLHHMLRRVIVLGRFSQTPGESLMFSQLSRNSQNA
jgi:hypothetical protein